MFKKIRIESYRGLENVVLDNLAAVNILVGDNNCGKTSVLEAIQMLSEIDSPDNIIRIARNREAPMLGNELMPFDLFEYSFPIDMEFRNIAIQGYGEQSKYKCSTRLDMLYGFKDYIPEEYETFDRVLSSRRKKPQPGERIRYLTCKWNYSGEKNAGGEIYMDELLAKIEYTGKEISEVHEPVILMNYISPMDAYTNSSLEKGLFQGMLTKERESLVKLLRMFDENIMGIDVSYRYTQPMPCIEIAGERLVPVSIYGDGLKKVLSIASVLAKSRDGILLIDEFDTSLHPEIMERVAEWLIQSAREYNVQLFITTHSKQALDALVNVADDKSVIMAYRLEHYNNHIFVRNFEGNQLQEWCVEGGASVL